jgi:hypothetical protein
MVRLAAGHVAWSRGGTLLGRFAGPEHPAITDGGEIIYLEREARGRLFNAGHFPI